MAARIESSVPGSTASQPRARAVHISTTAEMGNCFAPIPRGFQATHLVSMPWVWDPSMAADNPNY